MEGDRTHFAVRSPLAKQVWLCLFDKEGMETRYPMVRADDNWSLELPGRLDGQHYGYRADGEWNPQAGRWFDAAKLLVDPYARELDRRFEQNARLGWFGEETADIVPRAIVRAPVDQQPAQKPIFSVGGLIYEVNVRGFTIQHPEVPEAIRGTVAALATPPVIEHLKRLHVTAVELMPIVAWIDERHLPPLGLRNGWGYNPVAPMALDPGLCPGGVQELRETVAALHEAGIGVLLDLVFNHTGESDVFGGTICLRGLDAAAYAAAPDGMLLNDTGCGNTLDFARPSVRQLTLDSLRHFVTACGVDGFRFDLAPVLARGPGFAVNAPIFADIANDVILADRVMIAEPWDIGPGGYQLGNFPSHWLEWNDRFRDDVRRFWRGDEGIGVLATRLAGSSDVFGPSAPGKPCRSVNFLAAHDGFTLADCVAYASRHNELNGESNLDGHRENYSWNNGVEGVSADLQVLEARQADLKALLATLFGSVGTIMLTAGDEFGRTQEGNNNAYCQDNPIGWVDWHGRDRGLEGWVFDLAARRAGSLEGFVSLPYSVSWLRPEGAVMLMSDWEDATADGVRFERQFADEKSGKERRITIAVRRQQRYADMDIRDLN
nr:glycogen debranching protein GlgX [Novosphingobium sp. 9]